MLLKADFIWCILTFIVKSMGLWLAAVPTRKAASSGALAESTEYALGYIWAECGAFRLISARYPYLHRLLCIRPLGSLFFTSLESSHPWSCWIMCIKSKRFYGHGGIVVERIWLTAKIYVSWRPGHCKLETLSSKIQPSWVISFFKSDNLSWMF